MDRDRDYSMSGMNATRRYSIATYEGGQCIKKDIDQIYIIFNDKDDSFHYVTPDGKHHRIYGGVVVVDEI